MIDQSLFPVRRSKRLISLTLHNVRLKSLVLYFFIFFCDQFIYKLLQLSFAFSVRRLLSVLCLHLK